MRHEPAGRLRSVWSGLILAGCLVVLSPRELSPQTRDETERLLAELTNGAGPGIFVFDNSMIPNNNYVEWILRIARDSGIPIQFESVTGYGEDAAMVQKSARGVPAVNIGVPTRYGHSQSGIIDRADYDHTVALVVAMIERLSAAGVASLLEF